MDKNAVCETLTGLAIERYAMQQQIASAAKKIEELQAANKILDDEVTRLREAKE